MSSQSEFIEQIGPLIQKYAKQYGYQVCSPIIAQACLESRFGQSGLAKHHNYFGMKCGKSWTGKSVNMSTMEEYSPGVLTSIRDNFRVYNNMSDGVKGYFDFINTDRYKNLKTATTPRQYLELIKQDGYATSSSYVASNMHVVETYNLTRFDKPVEILSTSYNARITANQLNVRDTYSQSGNVLFKLPKNMLVRVIQETDNGWARLDDIVGWVSTTYLRKL